MYTRSIKTRTTSLAKTSEAYKMNYFPTWDIFQYVELDHDIAGNFDLSLVSDRHM